MIHLFNGRGALATQADRYFGPENGKPLIFHDNYEQGVGARLGRRITS